MTFKSPSTIRSQLTRLVLASVLPVWLLCGFLMFYAYSDKREEANDSMLDRARSLTMVLDRELMNVQSALSAFSTSPSFANGDFASVHRQALRIVKAYPEADIIAADITGQQLVNSFRPYGTPLPKRKNPDTVRRVFSTGRAVCGDLYYGALTGRPLISIDVPVIIDGKVKYDLAMTIPANSLGMLLLKQNLPPGQYVSIIDAKQVLVSRSRFQEKYLGKKVSPKMSQAVALAPEGIIESANFEGKQVYSTFCRSANSGWTVIVGVSKESGYAEVYTWLAWAVAGAVFSLLVGIASAAHYARRIAQAIHSLIGPALSIGRGEPIAFVDKYSIKETGKVAAALVQASDLIQARHGELLQSEQRYSALFANKLSALAHCRIVTDEQGRPVDYRILEINEAYERILGVKKCDIEGRTVRELFPGFENDAFHYIDLFGKVALEGGEIMFDGFFEVNQQYLSTYAYCPQPGEFTVIFTDVTESRQTQQSLLESEGKYRALFENAGDAIFIHDQDARMLAVNPQAGAWLGYSTTELMSMTIMQVVSPEHAQVTPDHIVQLMAKGSHLFEAEARHKDGTFIPAQVSARRINWHGTPAMMSTCHDIRERKLAEDARLRFEGQLLQAQKQESLVVLAGGIAHDFNNILMAILGNAELGMMCVNGDSPVAVNLHRIEQAAARAAELTKQMLAYSGKGRFVIEDINLNELIEQMLRMLEVSISKNALVRLHLHQPLPLVEADATQMSQVIMNLAINASEALGIDGGVIDITTGCSKCDRNHLREFWQDESMSEGNYICLEVADTGCGMNKETMAKLFDPFFTTKFTGRGLGMAAVQGIVKGHKGAIKVYSESGKGTTFTVLLPAGSHAAGLPHPEIASEDYTMRGTVLLVDDEETVRSTGSQLLKALGFTPITANDGLEALSIFKATPEIAFVILDLTMPRMDGEQCFRELRQLAPLVKVIMSSGYHEQEVTQKFIGRGLSGFLQKPYKLSALRDTVKTMVERT
jgi:PAS domain S-box-containing protein